MNRICLEKRGNGGEGLRKWRVASACGMSLLLLLGQTAPLLGNPTGGAVVAGSATIGAAGPTLSINQSTQNAIINWQQFSIASGETTKFIVPNSGATLNRVIGGNPSAIYGSLQSNGTLYLVNPNGIVVGPSGRIDTAGFLASTLDISNQQFLSGGDLEFAGNSGASVENDGVIHASTGDVYLIASQVTNKGTLSAPQGTVGLAAGNDVLFHPAGSQLFVQATPAGTTRALGVTNSGTIRAAAAELKAAGGNAYALAINNTGAIAATGFKKINGQVYLTSDGGSISNSGKISAKQANGNGGTIVVDGTATTSTTSGTVTNSGLLDASATVAGGQGGSVTLKNMGGNTVQSGKIIAKGGQGGSGGNAEVSGATVGFTGMVDLTAPGGTTGDLLLDPTTFTVAPTGGDETGAEVSSTLQTANLTLNADDTVIIDDAVTWTSSTTLTLSTNLSGSSIVIAAPISGVNGGLTIDAAAATDGVAATGSVNVASFILQSGSWTQDSSSLPAFTASKNFELEGTSNFIRIAGFDSNNDDAEEITDVYGLQGLGSPSGDQLNIPAELVDNIDASGTATWNSGAGFAPIGSFSVPYNATFNGMGHIIDGLTIDTPSVPYVALFGGINTATIENVSLKGVQIDGAYDVGGLIGSTTGAGSTIDDVYVSGSITSTGFESVGGLAGYNSGTISNVYSTANVTTSTDVNYVGGLVGYNVGTINDTYSSGLVSAGAGSTNVGGLIGYNGRTVTNSFWDTTTSGQSTSAGGTGDPTATLLSSTTYSSAGWSIGTDPTADTWVILTGQTRPMLAMEYSTTIFDAHQLQLIDLNSTTLAASYTLARDLGDGGITNPSEIWGTSLTSGAGFVPIGNSTTNFTGTFNGLGHTLGNLYINSTSDVSVGLFGYTGTGALVENAGVINVDLTGNNNVGALVGYNNGGTITDSYSTGSVSGNGSVGGLVGFGSTGAISDSYSSATASGVSSVGGLAGQNYGGTITNCYSTGSVSASSSGAGSLAGYNGGTITDTYGTGAVSGGATDLAGLVGYNAGTIDNSFWDTTTTGQSAGIGGGNLTGATGDPTTTLLSESTYSDATWSIGTSLTGDTWVIFTGQTRPLLSMEYSTTITNAHQLQLIGLNSTTLTAGYTLSGNIDASGTTNPSDVWGTSTTNGGAGFVPIGYYDFSNSSDANTFSGTLNGEGYTISGLTVNLPSSTSGTGLFGDTANTSTVENLNLTAITVTGDEYVGGLAGVNNATVIDVTSSGAIAGVMYTGGLLGISYAAIINSSTAGTVTGSGYDVGGLVGFVQGGSVTGSSNSATVNGTYSNIGGLVGLNEGAISNSDNTGMVEGIEGTEVGGLVGTNYNGSIVGSYSSGAVFGGGSTGGLVGANETATIAESYSTGAIEGDSSQTGGLVGYNSGTLTNVYSTSAVTSDNGSSDVGGLVGYNPSGTVTDAYSTGHISAGVGSSAVGGLLGYNGGTVANGFWDTTTAGVAVAVGSGSSTGIVGATTTQLESQAYILANAPSSPTYDFTNVWTTNGGTTTPELIGVTSGAMAPTLDALSGTAFTDSGVTEAASGTTIDLIFDGSLLGSTTTNSSGGFSFNISATDLTSGVLLTDATDNGNTYYQANSPASTIPGIDIWGSTLRTMGDTASTSALGAAAGSLTTAGINYTASGALITNYGVNLNILSNYALSGGVIAANNITINSPLTSNTSNLTIIGGSGNITVNDNVTITGGGGIYLMADNTGTGVGTVVFNNEAQVSTSGPVSIFFNPSVNPAGSAVNSTSYVDPTEDYTADVTGGGTVTAYMLVNTLNDLQNVQNNLSGTYALSHNIDATATSGWNGGAGFVPIGNDTTNFTGTFNGQNYAINGLTINRPSTPFVGLFGETGSGASIQYVGLTNEQVTGDYQVGGLVGLNNFGVISSTYVDGSVTATGYATGGGTSSNLAGLVTELGGLVGSNNQGSIRNSYTTGTVTGPSSGGGNMGGLVGENYNGGSIANSFSLAAVSGSASVGGLVGANDSYNDAISTISDSYSAGLVSGAAGSGGGLVGYANNGPSSITDSFWDTETSGQTVGDGDGSNSGITGATTAQLTSQSYITQTAPSFDFTSVWTTVGDTLTPQLIDLPQTSLPTGGNMDTLSGTAFTDSGVTEAASGTAIDLIYDGSLLGSTTTNSSGGFSFSVSTSDLTSGILLTDATDNGNTYYQANSPASTITGVDIWGSTLRVIANTASNTALGTAAGTLSGAGINYSVNAAALATNTGVNMEITSPYTLDGSITASSALTTTSAASLTSSVSSLTLAASSMNLAGSLTSSGQVTINSAGTVLDSGAVSVGSFVLGNGTWTQIVGQNGLTSLPTFTDSGDFELQGSSTFERFAGVSSSSGNPYEIADIYGLQGLASPSNALEAANAELVNNIDASGTSSWNSSSGFDPIGSSTPYTGTFNGQGFTHQRALHLSPKYEQCRPFQHCLRRDRKPQSYRRSSHRRIGCGWLGRRHG